MQPSPPSRRWTAFSPDPTVRTLSQQLIRATAALDAALESRDADPDALRDAREALEAFQLLERTSDDYIVPRQVRRQLLLAADHLEDRHLELARAEVGRAGGAFQEHLTRRWRA